MSEPGRVDDYAHLFEVRGCGLVEGWPERTYSDGQEAWSVAGIHRIAARPIVGAYCGCQPGWTPPGPGGQY